MGEKCCYNEIIMIFWGKKNEDKIRQKNGQT